MKQVCENCKYWRPVTPAERGYFDLGDSEKGSCDTFTTSFKGQRIDVIISVADSTGLDYILTTAPDFYCKSFFKQETKA